MHICNAVKYLSVITNNLVLGGVLHWRWDWGHVSSSYNLSSAPFCAEVLWRDKLLCCSSEIPVFSRCGRLPCEPMGLVWFWNSLSERWVWATFPPPQLSVTNIFKDFFFSFPLLFWGKLFYCWLWTFFFLIHFLCLLGRRGQEVVKLYSRQQPSSFWLGRALLNIQAPPLLMRAGSSSAVSGLPKEPRVKLRSLPCWPGSWSRWAALLLPGMQRVASPLASLAAGGSLEPLPLSHCIPPTVNSITPSLCKCLGKLSEGLGFFICSAVRDALQKPVQ